MRNYVDAINKTPFLYCRDHKDFTAPHAAVTEPRGRVNALPERRFAGPGLATYVKSITQTSAGTATRKGGINESQRCGRYHQAVTQCKRGI